MTRLRFLMLIPLWMLSVSNAAAWKLEQVNVDVTVTASGFQPCRDAIANELRRQNFLTVVHDRLPFLTWNWRWESQSGELLTILVAGNGPDVDLVLGLRSSKIHITLYNKLEAQLAAPTADDPDCGSSPISRDVAERIHNMLEKGTNGWPFHKLLVDSYLPLAHSYTPRTMTDIGIPLKYTCIQGSLLYANVVRPGRRVDAIPLSVFGSNLADKTARAKLDLDADANFRWNYLQSVGQQDTVSLRLYKNLESGATTEETRCE